MWHPLFVQMLTHALSDAFSRIFLKDRRRIIKELVRSDESALLKFMMQFVQKSAFLEEGFTMKG